MITESTTTRWLRGLWEFYREYTHTAIHAASAAALTAFGLLIFINRVFVVLAIAAYVLPPIILYSLGSDIGKPTPASKPPTAKSESSATGDSAINSVSGNGDTDSDSDNGDTDSDSDDGDTDSDSDNGDTDSDSDDGDTDSDGTDTDTDTDS
ncbi:hypothetical protein [Haladaptatus caseinilyticus]|uniref:hypothetical protein n=1 Tax=Haladaptatus caseinilyticus TaxID=2993314 RepID=UPI00224B82BC|nr:hypothetical protein [Haladaptatus caseinilyticus]